MSRLKVIEHVPKTAPVQTRHIFVIGSGGERVGWSPGAQAAVPTSLVTLVSGCLVPFAEEASIGEIVMHIGERFTIYLVRNAATGPSSYAVIVDEVADAR